MLHVDVCYAAMSVPCSLVVTCWERTDLLAVVFVVFCHFPKCVPNQCISKTNKVVLISLISAYIFTGN